ncbi:MAG: 2OG-Fe(II) oxygenase [Chitinophagales bacterium]
MEEAFDCLVNSYLENSVGITENFLPEELIKPLRQNVFRLYETERMHEAGVGNNAKLIRDKQTRSDKIFWLDRKEKDQFENSFLDVIDQFVAYLNSTCYAGISNYEFHYALYEKGSFYKRHIDQFRDNNKRAFTMIMYLTDNWQAGDGGELCIYHEDRTEKIAPTSGKCVFFKSSALEHEVLLSHAPRMSITGWLKTN